MLFRPFFSFCLLLCWQALVSGQGDLNLELASVVFRHGQRSPIQSFPLDAYSESDWPQGFGQLSELGMKQHYHLGNLFRERYVGDVNCSGLVCGNYTRVQVTIRSTDVDRTLMSAESQLASLFAPEDEELVFENLAWRPVPIHTVPTNQDALLRNWDNCPRYHELNKEFMKSPEYLKKDEENKDFFALVENNTGLVPVNLSNVWMIYDTVKIENGTEGYSSPPWVTEEVMQSLKTLNDYTMTQMFNGTEMNKLTAGVYLGKILSDMKNRTDPSINMTQRLFLYSAHDTTVAAVMSALHVFDSKQPGYATAFAVELYSDENGTYFVQFFLRKGPDSDTFHLIKFPHCKNMSLCTLQEFEMYATPLIPTDIAKACQISPSPSPSATSLPPSLTPTPSPSPNSLEKQNRVLKTSVIALGSFLSLTLLVAIILVVIIITSRKKNRRQQYGVLVEE